MKEILNCENNFFDNKKNMNYCYFQKLIYYYKSVLSLDNVDNCIVYNKETDILNCLIDENNKIINVKDRILFKLYPIKKFITDEYILKYKNLDDILGNIFGDLILPLIINQEEEINIKNICISISILSQINEKLNYLYLFLLNIFMNKSLKNDNSKKLYLKYYYICFNNFNEKIIKNDKYSSDYNKNIYLSILISLNPNDVDIFTKLSSIIKLNGDYKDKKIFNKIKEVLFSNKLFNNIYISSDVLYNYMIYLYDKDGNDSNCKIFLNYLFIFLKNHKKTNIRTYQQIIELFINKLNNNLNYFNKLCDSIKDELHLSHNKTIKCKQPIEVTLTNYGRKIKRHNIICDELNEKPIEIENGPCKITVKDCKIFYKQENMINNEKKIIENIVPIEVDKYPISYNAKINQDNNEDDINNICKIEINNTLLKNIKNKILLSASNLKKFVYMNISEEFKKLNKNNLYINDLNYLNLNNEIVFLLNINKRDYNNLLVKNKYLTVRNLKNKEMYYKNKLIGKIDNIIIEDYIYIFLNDNEKYIYIKIDENNINDISFKEIYYKKKIYLESEDINNCFIVKKDELCDKKVIKQKGGNNEIYMRDVVYEPFVLNINNMFNTYYKLNNILNKDKLNFDFKIDMKDKIYRKTILIDVLNNDLSNKKEMIFNKKKYIFNELNDKILYINELKELYSSNGLYNLKIGTDDIYDKLILLNLIDNKEIWNISILKRKNQIKSFILKNYDLYLKYEDNSIIQITFNNYNGKYKNLCKLELSDLGELEIKEPNDNIIWSRTKINKKQELLLDESLISSLNGKYKYIIKKITKTATYQIYKHSLIFTNEMNENTVLYEYKCNIINNKITYKDIISNCSSKIDTLEDNEYLELTNTGELQRVKKEINISLLNNSLNYNYIDDKELNLIKHKELDTILNDIYIELDIGKEGLGGKLNTEEKFTMSDEKIKKYMKAAEKGGDTKLKLKYKSPYIVKYINTDKNYKIKNKKTGDEYNIIIYTKNIKKDIIIEINKSEKNNKLIVKFNLNADSFNILGEKLPYNIKESDELNIYDKNINITDLFIKHYSLENENKDIINNLNEEIICHGGNIYGLDNLEMDINYYNNYKSNDLINIDKVDINNKTNISASQNKLFGSGGPGGVIGNSKSNNKKVRLNKMFKGGYTKEIRLNKNLKVLFNTTDNIIQIENDTISKYGPKGGPGGFINLSGDPKKNINGLKGIGFGSGGGGGGRYIESEKNYHIGNGGDGYRGGVFIINCYYDEKNILKINEILKYEKVDFNKPLINLGNIFNKKKFNKKISHIYILLIGGGGGGSIQGYGGNGGNIMICSINKNIENILKSKNICLKYDKIYGKNENMNIIINKMSNFDYLNVLNKKYILKNVFSDISYSIYINDSSYRPFKKNDNKNKHVINFVIKDKSEKIVLDTSGIFNYSNKTNSLSIFYDNKYLKFNEKDVNEYQWELLEETKLCINNITEKNILYFVKLKVLDNIYYNIDNIEFNCENIFNNDKDWIQSNYVHSIFETKLKYVIIECNINININDKICNENIILKIIQYYKNKKYNYKACILNMSKTNMNMILNKDILFEKNKEYDIKKIYKVTNNLYMNNKRETYIKLKENVLYFIDTNNLCNNIENNVENIKSNYHIYYIYSNSNKLRNLIQKNNTILKEIYIKNINDNEIEIFKIKILKNVLYNIYSVIINKKEIELNSINLKNDIYEIVDPCETLLDNRICCPIPDLSLNNSCNLDKEDFCQFEGEKCPNNYINILNVYNKNKRYFLYYKHNLGIIDNNVLIEGTLSNFNNNTTNKVKVYLNMIDEKIKNELLKSNNVYDILKNNRNPISFIKYLSKKELNKVLIRKTYKLKNIEYKENSILSEKDEHNLTFNTIKKEDSKEYNKIEYIFENESIKLKNMELEMKFTKNKEDKLLKTEFYKGLPTFSFNKKYRKDNEIKDSLDNSLLITLGYLPELRKKLLKKYNKEEQLKILLKIFVCLLSGINEMCYPKHYINCVQTDIAKNKDDKKCNKISYTDVILEGHSNIVNSVNQCQTLCENNKDCLGGFYRTTGNKKNMKEGECWLSSYLENESSDCGTGCIGFEKRINNPVCICKNKNDKNRYIIEDVIIKDKDNCDEYCKSKSSEINISGYEYENVKNILLKELENYLQAYKNMNLITSEINENDYINIIRKGLNLKNISKDTQSWYYKLSFFNKCEVRQMLLGIIIEEIYILITNDKLNIKNILNINNKIIEKELIKLFQETQDKLYIDLIISYIYSNKSDLYITKLNEIYKNNIEPNYYEKKYKNIILDIILLETIQLNDDILLNILYNNNIKLNEIKTILDNLYILYNKEQDFIINRNIIKSYNNINKFNIEKDFNTISINWKILNNIYKYKSYPLINNKKDDLKKYPQNLWFNKNNYLVEKDISNNSHIIKKIYEYNHDISKWILFEKTTDIIDNKYIFKEKDNIISSRINNKVIKTIIIYEKNENIKSVFPLNEIYLFKTYNDSNDYYNINDLYIELINKPKIDMILNIKNYLDKIKSEIQFLSTKINNIFIDFAVNDKNISLDNRITILKTFPENMRNYMIKFINNSEIKDKVLTEINKELHTHLAHYGHNINDLSNENIKEIYESYKKNYDNNVKNFKLPPHYFEIIPKSIKLDNKNIIALKWLSNINNDFIKKNKDNLIKIFYFNKKGIYKNSYYIKFISLDKKSNKIYGYINKKDINIFKEGDIITTNIKDKIIPSPKNITNYSHIHESHSHDNINMHIHDNHKHYPLNMIAFIIIKLYYNNNTNVLEFIRYFDNINTNNIIDFKYINKYYNINKIEIIINKFNKENSINCKLNIKELNAFIISNPDNFDLGQIYEKDIKLNMYDNLTINKRLNSIKNLTGGTSENNIENNNNSWCLINNQCYGNMSKYECIIQEDNLKKNVDDIYGYGTCPNLVDVWCKTKPDGICNDIRSSDNEWKYIERTNSVQEAQDICMYKSNNKFEKRNITGEGLCETYKDNQGYWCNNNLLNECYDWNTYNKNFKKYDTYEEHKKECDKINNTNNSESGYGTCKNSDLENIYCYDKNNDICYDKYSKENDFYPIENRKNNSINNCLKNYDNLSEQDKISISNRGTCKENKPNSKYI